MNNPDTKEYNILTRQAAIKTDKSHSWITYIRKLLRQYDLPILYDLIDTTPASSAWKLTVKRAVQCYWWTEISGDAQNRTTLNNLDITQCHLGKLHPVWDTPLHRSAILQATTHCRMLTGTYNVQEKYNKYNNTQTLCPACKSAKETLHHLLMDCPAYETIRSVTMDNIKTLLETASGTEQSSKILKQIHENSDIHLITLLNPYMLEEATTTECVMAISSSIRQFTYAIHAQRTGIVELA